MFVYTMRFLLQNDKFCIDSDNMSLPSTVKFKKCDSKILKPNLSQQWLYNNKVFILCF